MKRVLENKKILIVVSIVLVVAVVGCLFLPSLFESKTANYNYKLNVKQVTFNKNDFDVSLGDEFYYNSAESSFAIVSKDGKALFNSHSAEASADGNCAIMSLRLRDKKGNAYFFDTSSNSVPFKSFELTDKTNNGFSIKYDLFPDEKNAQAGVESAKIFACVVISFELANRSLLVSVNTENIQLPNGFVLEKLSILPGILSVPANTKAEFIVPDGCGALIDTNVITEKPVDLNLDVYGSDVALYGYEKGAELPYFASTKNGYLLNTVITQADALSAITCKKQAEGGGYLYNTFTVTPCSVKNGKFIKGASYEGVLAQSYTLTQGGDYNDVAAQVRDALIKKDYLNASLLSKTSDLPFFINVVGTLDGETPFTTFENAAEITALLKSRGVRNISLRYSGYGKKGLATDCSNVTSFSKILGDANEFKKLTESVSSQGNTIHLDVNLFSDYNKKSGNFTLYDETARLCGGEPPKFDLNQSDINSTVSDIYKFVTTYPATGVCLNDGSMVLASDIGGKLNRAQVLANMQESVGALGAAGGFMLSEPVVYLMKEAQSVFVTPSVATCEDNSAATSVPILQMVIHGSVIYGGNSINVTGYSPEDAFLKCIEYGGVPSFTFTHSNNTAISYSTYATQTSKLYSRAKAVSPLLNMKMTSHEKVTDGVYKITYDYSKIVYVNYNPSVVEINGVMISAKDFIVI